MDLKNSVKHTSPAAIRITVVILISFFAKRNNQSRSALSIEAGFSLQIKELAELCVNSEARNRSVSQRLGIAFRYTLSDFVIFQFAVKGGGGNVEQPCRFGFIPVGVVQHFLNMEFFGTG